MDRVKGFRVSLVLPASGTGERMGLLKPKQFCDVLGRPLITFTIAAFHRIPWIADIIVTVSEGYKELLEDLVAEYGFDKVTVVVGGLTRHRSIYNGVKALQNACSHPEIVLIHDAVRLFAEEDLVKEIAEAALKYGASGVTRPLVSTVIASDSEGTLSESLDRSQYAASEMPQGFRYKVIREAYDKSTDFDLDYGTECLLLAKKHCGIKAHIVEGKPYLWKVTHKKDLYAAEGMLKENLLKVSITSTEHKALADSIEECLSSRLSKDQVRQEISDGADSTIDRKLNTFIHIRTLPLTETQEQDMESSYPRERTLLDHCHIDVLVAEPQTLSSSHHSLCLHYKQLATKVKGHHLLVYALLSKTTADHSDISHMVTHLVMGRSPVLSGQVFLV